MSQRYPEPPGRFTMGDNRRFHWRSLNGKFQVYSIGLDHWAMCETEEHAAAVADALEALYDNMQLPDRCFQICTCTKCGLKERCTPFSDFYTLPNDDKQLLCESCFRRHVYESMHNQEAGTKPTEAQ